MHAFTVLRALGVNDLRLVRRDALLSWMVFMPLLMIVLVRWVVPEVTTWAAPIFDLEPYYPLVLAYFFVLMVPLMFGVVVGFILLDERDDNTLMALQVTPLQLEKYLLYRMTAPMILSVIATLLAVPLSGLMLAPFLPLLLVALVGAMEAPMFALLVASVAENKVQGFALMKGLGVFLVMPIVAYFIAWPWHLIVGVFPTYWPAQAFLLASAGGSNWWIYLVVGVVIHLGLLWVLWRRFHKVMHR